MHTLVLVVVVVVVVLKTRNAWSHASTLPAPFVGVQIIKRGNVYGNHLSFTHTHTHTHQTVCD